MPGSVRNAWMAACKNAGFPDLRWHDRHRVFAVTAIRAGVPLWDLQNLLGHKGLVMVLRYARHSPASFERQARDRIEDYFDGERRVRETRSEAISFMVGA